VGLRVGPNSLFTGLAYLGDSVVRLGVMANSILSGGAPTAIFRRWGAKRVDFFTRWRGVDSFFLFLFEFVRLAARGPPKDKPLK